ncbi:MAG: sugar phosphate isomerase/epimerase [Clostridia bacterium]|nr:sugar phosphate isomerase/epimerase [Clostridia bacterium]
MLLSNLTQWSGSTLSAKEAIKINADAGFDAYDISLFGLTRDENFEFNCDNYAEKARELREYADSLGIVCNQSHAPFSTSTGDMEKDKWIFGKIIRSMEIASILGAKIIVVHPKQHLCYADYAEELFNMNVEFYKSLIPYCEKFGIKVAAENMWQNNNGSRVPSDSTCSRAWEFNKYLDAVDSEWIVGCLDIGHVSLMNADIPDFIRKMGNKRLQALHVHDTDFRSDKHTLPFMEKIDFIPVCEALAEIDYQGDFTFEADAFYRGKPEELYPATTKYMCEVGRYLVSKIEEAKNSRA